MTPKTPLLTSGEASRGMSPAPVGFSSSGFLLSFSPTYYRSYAGFLTRQLGLSGPFAMKGELTILIVKMGIVRNERERGNWAFPRNEGSGEATPEKAGN